MNVLYVVADKEREWNSAEWRCAIPARAIARVNGQASGMMGVEQFAASTSEYNINASAVVPADIIIIQRVLCVPDVAHAAQYWRNMGKTVVVDLDDHYLSLVQGNPAWAYWNMPQPAHGGRRAVDLLVENVKTIDGVTSPSQRILKSWAAYDIDGYLLPNYAQSDRWQGLLKEAHIGFVVGWGGSFSHYDTWWRSGCAEGLRRAMEQRPDMRFHLWGADWRVAEFVPGAEWLGKIPPKRIGEWPQKLAQFDVAIAPLGGDYDQHRSWLHALEPMLAGVPWLGSRGDPWMELGKWGVLVDDTPEAWCAALLDAHDNYTTHRNRAEEAKKQAWNYTIERRIWDYLVTLQAIAAKRQSAFPEDSRPRIPGVVCV